ncbi:cell wall assembly regulator SMI1 [Mucilaginibacter sp. UYNi724]
MENSLIYKQCEEILAELLRFDSSLVDLGNSINDDRIRLVEKNIGFLLPLDFKYILSIHNGISLIGTEVYGLDGSFKETSLNKIYHFEHFEVDNKMPSHFFPFSPDGGGNHYCLDLSKIAEGLCPVVFWQWDFNYSLLEEAEITNDNFMEWVQEVMIDWTLEDTNHDGSEKKAGKK